MWKTIIQIITIYRVSVFFLISEDNFISEIKFIDENTVLCCSEKSGEIILIDLRNNKKDSLKFANKKECYKDYYWTMDVMVNTLYRLSSAGNIILSDLRNGANHVYKEVETCHRSKTNQSGIGIKVCFLF
jgi:WD40 repeat protein